MPKSPSRKGSPRAPGGGALDRTRQFAVSRGLPPPEVTGSDAPAPAKPAPRPAAKKKKGTP